MATPNDPLADNPETDIDSPEIHNIPLMDLETGEVTDPEEDELDEDKDFRREDI